MDSGRSAAARAPAAALALALALLLAGCLGGGDDASPGATSSASLEAGDVTAADETLAEALLDPTVVPRWNVGDAWSVTSHGFSEESFMLVVTAASGSAYTLASTSEQNAGFDAMFDVSYLGDIRASDLAGSQQGSPVLYYSWPLADGKTWVAAWDGLEVHLTATKSSSGDGGFTIVGKVDDVDYVHYDYVPALKWWSHLDFVRDGYGITIASFESGWTGEVAAAVAKEVYRAGPATAPTASANSGAFTIDEGQTFAMVTLVGGGAQWARVFSLVDPAGTPYQSSSIPNFEMDGAGMQVFQQERIPATPGEWHVVNQAVHDPTGGFTLTVHQVAVSKLMVGS